MRFSGGIIVCFILLLAMLVVTPVLAADVGTASVITKTSTADIAIKIAIGDSKELSLKPILSLSKNDATIKTSLQTAESSTASDTADKTVWDGTKTTLNLYEYSKGSREAPDGGYEYEVILKSKPATNTLTFNLDTKNLVAYYQPPLNEERPGIKGCNATSCENATRPENIVGSYAFYTPEGKKVFHLYRPLITDAKGNKIWGALNITGSTMTITIEQAWLDKAAYPVVVDPTWGYTTWGASQDSWNVQNAIAYRFTAPSGMGTLLSIHAVTNSFSATINPKGAIWNTDFSLVNNSVTSSWSQGITTAWGYGNFTSQPTLTQGNDYYIGYVCDYAFYDQYDSGTTNYMVAGTSTYSSPGAMSSVVYRNRLISVYVEYIASGGGDTTPPASISGFANTTSCSGTNISFLKPGDTDYNGFMAWWNNVAEPNQTNATTWYNKSGLTESTLYTLSTKTFDLTGNVNATFQNYSITTGACGAAPVAAFSASNTTMCVGNVTRFTDESTNTPTSWYWEFGDGNTSTTQSPLVQYDVIGLKTVNLKATNAYGSDWENKTGYINVTTCAAPTPTPTPTPTTATPTPTPTTPPTYSSMWCGVQDLYFQDIPSGIDGFRDLHNYASGNALVDENVTITNTDGVVFIDSYISPPGALTNVKLLEGLRNYNIYGYVSSVAQPSYFTFNVSRYDTSTNTEVFFYNISSVAISSVTPTLDKTYYTSQKNVSFTSTERILIRIGAYTTRNTATTIHFLNQGTTPTYVQSGYFKCPVVSGGGGGNINPAGNYMALTFIAIGIAALGLFVAVYALRRRQLYK